jgi:hypothetical protein
MQKICCFGNRRVFRDANAQNKKARGFRFSSPLLPSLIQFHAFLRNYALDTRPTTPLPFFLWLHTLIIAANTIGGHGKGMAGALSFLKAGGRRQHAPC